MSTYPFRTKINWEFGTYSLEPWTDAETFYGTKTDEKCNDKSCDCTDTHSEHPIRTY